MQRKPISNLANMGGIPIQVLNGTNNPAVDGPLFDFLNLLLQTLQRAEENQLEVTPGTISLSAAKERISVAINSWFSRTYPRDVAFYELAQEELERWPEFKFWQTIWYYRCGNADVNDVYQATYIKVPELLSGQSALYGDVNPNKITWEDVLKLVQAALNKMPSKQDSTTIKPPVTPPVLPPVKTPNTSWDINTVIMVGGAVFLGGMILYRFKSKNAAGVRNEPVSRPRKRIRKS